MIFKHLFRSKHENPDPQVRIKAIENLNKEDPQQKTVLHELAFNDSDVNVSLAALQKLDSFVLWYKMSEIAKNDRVAKRSQKVVEDTLLTENNTHLDEQEKRKFIVECRDNKLLEKLLFQNWVLQDTELAIELMVKIGKPQLKEKLLLENQNENLQLSIIDSLLDAPQNRKLLSRLIKRNKSSELNKKCQTLLDNWLHAESLPLEIERQVKMVLSLLLALKDSTNLPEIQVQQQTLLNTYHECAVQFDCLSDVKKQEIETKFSEINSKINNTIELLTPQWQAQQALVNLESDIEILHANAKLTLDNLSRQLSTRACEMTLEEVSIAQAQLAAHIQQIQVFSTKLNASNKSSHQHLEWLHQTLLSSQTTLHNLPEFQKAIAVAIELVEKFENLPLPNDQSQIEAAEDFSKELKQQWRDTVLIYRAQIPNELSKKWAARSKEWQLALKSLKTQVNAELSRCRNKIRAVDSLINQGKFKAAMGLFQKVEAWFAALPEKQQGQLEKSYSNTKEQVVNLHDWQEYIAAPRKPALLNEVEELIKTPLSIDAQADAIKSLRSQWMSLGKLDTEADQALNLAFDQAIEKAFEPCRIHYAKQQQDREQNNLLKQQILTELEELANTQDNTPDLIKSYRSVQQRWKNIGEVDYKIRTSLHERYQLLIAPIKVKINQFYDDNQQQKQKLLDKALKLADVESVSEAVEQVKKLQSQWKTIEHAGRKAETELWAAFRAANDKIFAKRAEQSQAQKQEVKQQLVDVQEKIASMQSLLSSATDKGLIQSALQEKETVNLMLESLPLAQRKVSAQKLQNLLELQSKKLVSLKSEKKRQVYRDLFSILTDWREGDVEQDVLKVLPKIWQACFSNIQLTDRKELLLKMEILAQLDSPQAENIQRQEVQMQLMANKLGGGDTADVQSLLKDWIAVGPLKEKEIEQLARLEKIFFTSP